MNAINGIFATLIVVIQAASAAALDPRDKPASADVERAASTITLAFQARPLNADTKLTDDLMKRTTRVVKQRIKSAALLKQGVRVQRRGDDRIEIIAPAELKSKIKQLKRLATRPGTLEFAILANRRDHAQIVKRALELPDNRTEYKPEGDKLVAARWHGISDGRSVEDLSTHGEVVTREVETARDKDGKRSEEAAIEFLVLVEPDEQRVTGNYLLPKRVHSMTDAQTGEYGVAFVFNATGAYRFARLTHRNAPAPDGFNRRLAIVLDGGLYSAPNLREPITGGSGQITGGFEPRDARELANVLKSGALPVKLTFVEDESGTGKR